LSRRPIAGAADRMGAAAWVIRRVRRRTPHRRCDDFTSQ